MNILGIDIGMKGALSFYNKEELMIYDMPIFKVKKGNDLDIHKVASIIKQDMPTHAFIEKAMFIPGNGKISYGKLQKAEGAFLGIFSALDIPYTIVAPSVWKKAMACPKEKDAARMRANQLLPQFAHNWDLKKHDGRAEASLIALYGTQQIK
jgi:crossover junction endodeoxyribonuclease RuvC